MAHSKKVQLGWLLLAVWLIATSIFLFWWRFQDFGVFDPKSQWLDRAPLTAPVAGKVIIHVRAGCFCDLLAQQHQPLLAAHEDYEQRTLTPQAVEALGIPVPATPMLLIVEAGAVIYAGPYASGPMCSPDNSFIPQLLGSTRNIQAPWYNGNTQACRCTT